MTDDVMALFRRAAAVTDSVIAAIRPEQLHNATPCTEWDVRALLNHVVTGNLLFVALATGAPRPDRTQDHLGEDYLGAFRDSVRRLTEAFEAPGFIDRTVPTPFGEGSGRVLVGMRFNEMIVHSWDLARATGQPTDFDPELAEQSLAWFRGAPMLSGARGPAGPFGEEQPAPESGTAADRLAAFVGRRV
jgi:uncharacterized protein (TIGR03086 family)